VAARPQSAVDEPKPEGRQNDGDNEAEDTWARDREDPDAGAGDDSGHHARQQLLDPVGL
jgi:hypothetical protein